MNIELNTIARPYAKAIYKLSKIHHRTEDWFSELELITQLCNEENMRNILSLPEITALEKSEIIFNVLDTEELDQYIKNFISVLAENDRLNLLPIIFYQYKEFVYEHDDISDATIYSAYELQDDELTDLVDKLENFIKRKLKVKMVVEHDLLGGFKVEFGDQILDFSLQSKLQTLKKSLLN